MARRKLIYGLYPESFTDGTRSAFAEMKRAVKLVDKAVEPDYYWLNPVFTSAGADGGYDIVDFYRINPRFGSQRELVDLMTGVMRGRALLDVVINHTSVESNFFQDDLRRRARGESRDNCIWLDQPLNWESLFGASGKELDAKTFGGESLFEGSAFEFNEKRGQYYLHLFSKGQADLNLKNPKVVTALRQAMDYWLNNGAAGFRIDTCNILDKLLKNDESDSSLKGFSHYHQIGSAAILKKIFGRQHAFTIGETIGASKLDIRELTRPNGPLLACFNAEVTDSFDGMFMDPAHPRKPNYQAFLETVVEWSKVPGFVMNLENHDLPRSVSRFNADPRALAFLQFMLPFEYICLYQGQELGMQNRTDLIEKGTINAYAADARAAGIYDTILIDNGLDLLCGGSGTLNALKRVDRVSRLHCRIPSKWIFGGEKYALMLRDEASIVALYKELSQLWREDKILLHGNLSVKQITKDGVLEFYRRYKRHYWHVYIDLQHAHQSFAENDSGIHYL